MPTVVLDPDVPEIEALRERRRCSGLDRLDEVWEGVLHMVPAPNHDHAVLGARLKFLLWPLAADAGLVLTDEFNLGESADDFRVPDGGLHRPGAAELWHPTATLVVEIVSPGDETWEKLPFYAAHQVDELLIVDPQERAVHWLALVEGSYVPIERSGFIALGVAELAAQLAWK
jgi:Uma2 family endonuclease